MSITSPASWLFGIGILLLRVIAAERNGAETSTTGIIPSLVQDGTCGLARVKCAYRVGCGAALHEYMVQCADVIAGRTTKCKLHCQRALIALTSTEEGKSLMACNCNGSQFCEVSKQRVEVCRPEVSLAVAEGSVVSCSVAQWICSADHLCATALEYYHQFCRAMFQGQRCTRRCNNSIAILDRQEKAAKLRTCYCDGTEEFPCKTIRQNTNRLCFGRETGGQIGGHLTPERADDDDTESDNEDDSEEGSSGAGGHMDPTDVDNNGIFGVDAEDDERDREKEHHRKKPTSSGAPGHFQPDYIITTFATVALTVLSNYEWLRTR